MYIVASCFSLSSLFLLYIDVSTMCHIRKRINLSMINVCVHLSSSCSDVFVLLFFFYCFIFNVALNKSIETLLNNCFNLATSSLWSNKLLNKMNIFILSSHSSSGFRLPRRRSTIDDERLRVIWTNENRVIVGPMIGQRYHLNSKKIRK